MKDKASIVAALVIVGLAASYYAFFPHSSSSPREDIGREAFATFKKEGNLTEELRGFFEYMAIKNSGMENSRSSVNPMRSCRQDADCILLTCAGAFNKEYAKNLPPDLPCATYAEHRAVCRTGVCTPLQK